MFLTGDKVKIKFNGIEVGYLNSYNNSLIKLLSRFNVKAATSIIETPMTYTYTMKSINTLGQFLMEVPTPEQLTISINIPQS